MSAAPIKLLLNNYVQLPTSIPQRIFKFLLVKTKLVGIWHHSRNHGSCLIYIKTIQKHNRPLQEIMTEIYFCMSGPGHWPETVLSMAVPFEHGAGPAQALVKPSDLQFATPSSFVYSLDCFENLKEFDYLRRKVF